jgi:hypothetical protein
MPRKEYEPAIPSAKRPQTYALDRAATEISSCRLSHPSFAKFILHSRPLIHVGYTPVGAGLAQGV